MGTSASVAPALLVVRGEAFIAAADGTGDVFLDSGLLGRALCTRRSMVENQFGTVICLAAIRPQVKPVAEQCDVPSEDVRRSGSR